MGFFSNLVKKLGLGGGDSNKGSVQTGRRGGKFTIDAKGNKHYHGLIRKGVQEVHDNYKASH
jgi:hypothetical protein